MAGMRFDFQCPWCGADSHMRGSEKTAFRAQAEEAVDGRAVVGPAQPFTAGAPRETGSFGGCGEGLARAEQRGDVDAVVDRRGGGRSHGCGRGHAGTPLGE